MGAPSERPDDLTVQLRRMQRELDELKSGAYRRGRAGAETNVSLGNLRSEVRGFESRVATSEQMAANLSFNATNIPGGTVGPEITFAAIPPASTIICAARASMGKTAGAVEAVAFITLYDAHTGAVLQAAQQIMRVTGFGNGVTASKFWVPGNTEGDYNFGGVARFETSGLPGGETDAITMRLQYAAYGNVGSGNGIFANRELWAALIEPAPMPDGGD